MEGTIIGSWIYIFKVSSLEPEVGLYYVSSIRLYKSLFGDNILRMYIYRIEGTNKKLSKKMIHHILNKTEHYITLSSDREKINELILGPTEKIISIFLKKHSNWKLIRTIFIP